MTGYLAIAAIWIFFATLVCVSVHGAKKTRRTQKAIEQARRNIKWPASSSKRAPRT
jgi:hypothetical protein